MMGKEDQIPDTTLFSSGLELIARPFVSIYGRMNDDNVYLAALLLRVLHIFAPRRVIAQAGQ